MKIKIIRKLLILVVIFSVVIPTYADMDKSKESSFPVGKGRGKIAYKFQKNYVINGPASFVVSDDNIIYILDDVEKQVEIFDEKNNYINTYELEKNDSYYDMEIKENKNIVLLTFRGNILEYDTKGNLVNKVKLGLSEKEVKMSELTKNQDGFIVLRNFLNGTDMYIDSRKVTDKYDKVEIKKVDEKKLNLKCDSFNVKLEYLFGIGKTQPLAHTKNQELIVLQTDVSMDKELKFSKKIININKVTGRKKYINFEKCRGEYYPLHSFYVTSKGQVYYMTCENKSIKINSLKYSDKDNSKEVAKMTTSDSTKNNSSLKLDPNRHYHAYLRGVDMVNYEWSFNPNTMITPWTSFTAPPDHLRDGSQVRTEVGIPYKWGGKTGLDTKDFGESPSMKSNYIDEINNGDTAGDIKSGNTYEYVVWNTAGIDCSGFIIAAFKLPYERSCDMIKSGAYEFEDSYWSLGFGGTASGAGKIGVNDYHVFMCFIGYHGIHDEMLGIDTIESTTSGYEDKTKEFLRSPDEIYNNNYVPMHLKEGY